MKFRPSRQPFPPTEVVAISSVFGVIFEPLTINSSIPCSHSFQCSSAESLHPRRLEMWELVSRSRISDSCSSSRNRRFPEASSASSVSLRTAYQGGLV